MTTKLISAVRIASIILVPNLASSTPQVVCLEARTRPFGPGTGGSADYGFAVDLDGDFAVIGAPIQDTDPGNPGGIPGRVYIMVRDVGTPGECDSQGNWTPPNNIMINERWKKDKPAMAPDYDGDLNPPGNPSAIRFGDSVSISVGTDIRLAVGAPFFDGAGSERGKVYVYSRDASMGWTDTPVELVAPTPVDGYHFGDAVAIDGDTLVVGEPQSPQAPPVSNGTAYVYLRSGTAWLLQGSPLAHPAPSVDDDYGASVALLGNTIVVGAPLDDELDSTMTNRLGAGAAYVWLRSGTVWSNTQKLNALQVMSEPQSFANFGSCISIDGDTMVVGAPMEDDQLVTDAGAAYVFTRSGTTWGFQQKLRRPVLQQTNDTQFGFSVDVSGDRIVCGVGQSDLGEAYVFTRSGTLWTAQSTNLQTELDTSDSRFGESVAVSGEMVLVGAPDDLVNVSAMNGSYGRACFFVPVTDAIVNYCAAKESSLTVWYTNPDPNGEPYCPPVAECLPYITTEGVPSRNQPTGFRIIARNLFVTNGGPQNSALTSGAACFSLEGRITMGMCQASFCLEAAVNIRDRTQGSPPLTPLDIGTCNGELEVNLLHLIEALGGNPMIPSTWVVLPIGQMVEVQFRFVDNQSYSPCPGVPANPLNGFTDAVEFIVCP